MKELLLISSICTLAAVLCPAQENRIPFADPYILEADGIYYMYGTSYKDGIGVVMSTDPKNWTFTAILLRVQGMFCTNCG